MLFLSTKINYYPRAARAKLFYMLNLQLGNFNKIE